MKKEIFPKEIIESTIEAHRFKHTNKSKVIYSFILFALIVALVSLPYINITIYNTSQGFIRSDKERIILQSSHIGKVVFHQLKNNIQINKGDTLLMINNLAIIKKINTTKSLLIETKKFIEDVKLLCSLDQNFLQLKSGFTGQLKKGMFVSARFELTERSLFDLLYDKIDDWLNPSNQIARNRNYYEKLKNSRTFTTIA